MFSLGKESTVSSTNTGEHHDTSDKVELEVLIQGGSTTSTLPHSNDKVHIDKLNLSTPSLDKPQVEDTYSITCHKSRRTIRKPARYALMMRAG